MTVLSMIVRKATSVAGAFSCLPRYADVVELVKGGFLVDGGQAPESYDKDARSYYATQAGIDRGTIEAREDLRVGASYTHPDWLTQPVDAAIVHLGRLGITSYHEFVDSMWVTHPGQIVNASMSEAMRRADRSLTIASLGLAGEAGEVVEHIKKHFRDGKLDKDAVTKELGDLIFYWFRLHTELGLEPLATLAANMTKLKARRAAGTIQGKGNER